MSAPHVCESFHFVIANPRSTAEFTSSVTRAFPQQAPNCGRGARTSNGSLTRRGLYVSDGIRRVRPVIRLPMYNRRPADAYEVRQPGSDGNDMISQSSDVAGRQGELSSRSPCKLADQDFTAQHRTPDQLHSWSTDWRLTGRLR
jgi:hypothetical protein